MKNVKIKDWYIENYPTDEMGEEINNSITFQDVYNALKLGIDIYTVIGAGDSIIRERIFGVLPNIMGVAYSEIYNMWLSA